MSDLWREWVKKADEDLRVALGALEKIEGENFNAVCFHAQQSVEKMLKAVLLQADLPVPRTHDLVKLAGLVGAAKAGFQFDDEEMFALTQAAVTFRYPGEDASGDEAREMLAIAGKLRGELMRLLTGGG